MKYNVFELGLDGKKVGTYSAINGTEARRQAAEEHGGAPSDYRVEDVHEREKVKCQRCGWEFMSPKPLFDRERRFTRCTLCSKERDVEHKANIFLKAKDELDEQMKKRAKAVGITVEELTARRKGL